MKYFFGYPTQLVVLAGSFLTSSAPALAQCDNGRPQRLSLGVSQFHCAAGWCKIYGAWADGSPNGIDRNPEMGGPGWDFAIEPVMYGIRPDGPAVGRVQDGDVLVAVNGRPIVSPSASRLLDTTEPGETLTLTVRRDGRLQDFDIVTEASCRAPSVAAGRLPGSVGTQVDLRGIIAAVRAARDSTRDRAVSVNRFDQTDEMGRLGMALACVDCVPEGRIPVWQFNEPPVVVAVSPEGPASLAGIQPGDRLLKRDSIPVTSPEGALRFGRVGLGESFQLTVMRGDREVTVDITVTPLRN